MRHRQSLIQTYLAALALASGAALWGASFLLSKYALVELSVLHVVLFRFVIGSAILTPILLMKRVPLKGRDVGTALLTGLFIALTILLQVAGVSFTSASSAALITGIFPPLLALAAFLLYKERLGLRGWVAVFASTIGVALLVGGPGAIGTVLGDFLVLISVFAGVTWTLLAKRMSDVYPPIVATAYIMLAGTLFLAPVALTVDGIPNLDLSPLVWFSVLGLGAGSTVIAYYLWTWGLKHMDASRAGVYGNLEPLAGALLGVFVAGETLGFLGVIGGTIVLTAAVTATVSSRHRDGSPTETGVEPKFEI